MPQQPAARARLFLKEVVPEHHLQRSSCCERKGSQAARRWAVGGSARKTAQAESTTLTSSGHTTKKTATRQTRLLFKGLHLRIYRVRRSVRIATLARWSCHL